MYKTKLVPIIFFIVTISILSLANQSFALSYDAGTKVTASDGLPSDLFGHAVSSSGNTLVVGAPGHGPNGQAYIFERTPGTNTWTESQILSESGAIMFGNTVSISGDTIVVGSPGSSEAYVYERGAMWTLTTPLSFGGAPTFGKSVTIDGDTIAVGATGHGVHLYERSDGWTTPFSIGPPPGSTNFGHAVSLNVDTLVIGDPGDAAYVFVRDTPPNWTQQGPPLTLFLTPEHFAQTVAVFGDTAVIGGPTDTTNGQAYVYERTGTTWSSATPVPNSSGQSVGVSDNEVVSGDAFLDSVFVNDKDNSWDSFTTFLGPDANAGFGLSVFNSAGALVVGAPHTQPNSEGAAHVFLRDLDMDDIADLDENDAGMASIGDTVFHDQDGDGVQGGGEPGIEGVVVNRDCLIGMDTTVTDTNGNYLFADIPAPTTCTMDVDKAATAALPTNALSGFVSGSCPETFNETLSMGEVFLDADFCFVTSSGSIGDTVFDDQDSDGVQNGGEPGIAGVTVDIDCFDGFADSDVTDANGNYLFAGAPALVLCSVDVDETTAPVSFNTGVCPTSFPISLGPGEAFLDADFCFESIEVVGDTVFHDMDLDGVQDAGDSGIAGVVVDIDCTNGFTDSALTDANGNYLFTGFSTPTTCTVNVDEAASGAALDGFSTGQCPVEFLDEPLIQGQAFLDADFCFETTPGTVGDRVFKDENFDGVQNGGEPGIEGVTVDISCDSFTDSDVTDANGDYEITGVPSLMLCSVDVDETTASPLVQGANCQDSFGVSLVPGETVSVVDFCFTDILGSIHVFGYLDVDGDGTFNAGDTAFPDTPGKTFELLDESGVIDTQTTINGMAWFENLVPGQYSVRENPVPDGFELTTLPNERPFTVGSGEELVYEDGAAMLPPNSQRVERNLGDELRWGNTEQVIPPESEIGGTILSIDSISLILAGAQMNALWIAPGLVAAVGIGLVILRRK